MSQTNAESNVNSQGQLQPVTAILPGVEAMQEQVLAWKRHRSGSDASEAEPTAEPAQTALQLEPDAKPQTRSRITPRPRVPAVMERNLARRAVFAVEPRRRPGEIFYETEDIVGALTVEMPLGQLSTFEMELVAWLLGRCEATGSQRVRFTLRECSRDFGTKWGGGRSEFLQTALDRLMRTEFRGVFFRKAARSRSREKYRIVAGWKLEERADSLDGPSRGAGAVTVELSSFFLDQVRENQFQRLDWAILRQGIKRPLAKRLYVFLESQKGFRAEGGMVEYEVTIDLSLMETLGCRDRHEGRVRSKLRQAASEIERADKRYQEVSIRRGRGPGVRVLRMVRAAS